MLRLMESRWTLSILAALMDGPRRFTDLKAALAGISATALAQKLKALEDKGLVFRRTHSLGLPVRVYELTGWGYEGRAMLDEFRKWACPNDSRDPGSAGPNEDRLIGREGR